MAEKKVTIMVLKVDLQCEKCYKKVKKVLCKFPQIRDQKYDEKANTVTITVVCCSPEKIRDKICRKGCGVIKSIEILPPPKPPAKPDPPKEKPKKAPEPDTPKEKPKEGDKPEKPKEKPELPPDPPPNPKTKPDPPPKEDPPKEPPEKPKDKPKPPPNPPPDPPPNPKTKEDPPKMPPPAATGTHQYFQWLEYVWCLIVKGMVVGVDAIMDMNGQLLVMMDVAVGAVEAGGNHRKDN